MTATKSMFSVPATEPADRGPRRLVAAVLVAGVLALHGSGLRWLVTTVAPDSHRVGPVLQVRQIAPPLVTELARPVPRDVPPVHALPRRVSKPVPAPPSPPQPLTALASVIESAPVVVEEGWVSTVTVAALPAVASATPLEVTPRPEAPPVYATQVTPPFEARYRMHRGAVSGDAVLQWTHDNKSYQLRLEARVTLLGAVLTQQSTGGFDSAGLAPQRFVDRRLRRGERAVNFVRPSDGSSPHISFSARTGQLPGFPGMQDRLSWIQQLSAIAAAWPGGGPHRGETIELQVAGPAGEVQHWVFVVAESEPGAATKLMREPSAAYDTAVQVWLDPTHHYQLRRLRLAEARGDALELIRVERDGTP